MSKILLLSRTSIITNTLPFMVNHEVEYVSSSSDAVLKLAKENYDAVIVFDDLEETHNPAQVVATIKEKFSDIPVLFFAYTEQSASKAKMYGADMTVTMPYFYNNHRDIVSEMLKEIKERQMSMPGYFREERREEKGT
ncbi:MAG: hypothetical protein N2440_01515 [Actinobacteria bacterium]|nr:hypothetical protein [Actinomycetota bacterium]